MFWGLEFVLPFSVGLFGCRAAVVILVFMFCSPASLTLTWMVQTGLSSLCWLVPMVSAGEGFDFCGPPALT